MTKAVNYRLYLNSYIIEIFSELLHSSLQNFTRSINLCISILDTYSVDSLLHWLGVFQHVAHHAQVSTVRLTNDCKADGWHLALKEDSKHINKLIIEPYSTLLRSCCMYVLAGPAQFTHTCTSMRVHVHSYRCKSGP